MIHETVDARRLRAKPRHKMSEPTSVAGPDGTARAHMLDLSATGALLHSLTPPQKHATVRLFVSGSARPARVMWVEDRRFGVHFRLPLSDAEMAGAMALPEPTVIRVRA